MRILVIGASGLLGWNLYDQGREAGHQLSGTYLSLELEGMHRLDITDPRAVSSTLAHLVPEVVLLPGAIPDVDLCERDPEATRAVNVQGVANVVSSAHALGARVVLFSTDYVFDGTRGAYAEDDLPAPLNEYGRQKLAAESLTLDAPGSLVLRVSGLFGHERRGKNFVARAVANLSAGREVRAPRDQRGCPTYAPDLAAASLALVAKQVHGIFHCSGPEALSRDDFARQVAQAFDLDTALVQGVSSLELNQLAPRPADASLDCSRVTAVLGRSLLGPAEGLARMRELKVAW